MIKRLNQQKLFGNDQFPNTVVEASKILNNHDFENKKNETSAKECYNRKHLTACNYVYPRSYIESMYSFI